MFRLAQAASGTCNTALFCPLNLIFITIRPVFYRCSAKKMNQALVSIGSFISSNCSRTSPILSNLSCVILARQCIYIHQIQQLFGVYRSCECCLVLSIVTLSMLALSSRNTVMAGLMTRKNICRYYA